MLFKRSYYRPEISAEQDIKTSLRSGEITKRAFNSASFILAEELGVEIEAVKDTYKDCKQELADTYLEYAKDHFRAETAGRFGKTTALLSFPTMVEALPVGLAELGIGLLSLGFAEYETNKVDETLDKVRDKIEETIAAKKAHANNQQPIFSPV